MERKAARGGHDNQIKASISDAGCVTEGDKLTIMDFEDASTSDNKLKGVEKHFIRGQLAFSESEVDG